MSANQLTKQVLEYCKLQGHFAFRINNIPGRKYRANTLLKGVPDILGITKVGIAFGIEIKTTDRQSKAQKEFERNFTNRFGVYIIAYKLEDVSAEI
jgi:hypothetical protein